MEVNQLIKYWDRVREGLLKTIEKFSEEELDFVAYQGGYSVRQIILHIAQEEKGEIQYGITGDLSSFPDAYHQKDYPTISTLENLLESVHDYTVHYLKSLTDHDLEMEIEAGWGGKYLISSMIWHVLEHEIHHRGELSLILGLLGREGLDA
jgi:uncharacterized damage-inducible protein DinB